MWGLQYPIRHVLFLYTDVSSKTFEVQIPENFTENELWHYVICLHWTPGMNNVISVMCHKGVLFIWLSSDMHSQIIAAYYM